MFRVDIDLSHCFVPPMDENGRGIVVTRSFEMPFPPFNGLFIAGDAFTETPSPTGFKLEDVTWDYNRSLFLAQTSLIHSELPIAYIPAELRSWVDRGWRLGSFEDTYEEEKPTGPSAQSKAPAFVTPGEDDFEAVKNWPSLGPRSRPKSFNFLLRALIREMADLFNNWSTAYAMDKTKQFFAGEELQGEQSKAKERFRNAVYEFEKRSFDEQWEWREKVLRTYPKLELLVANMVP